MRKLLFSLILGISHLTLNGIVNSEQMLNLYRQKFNSIEGWFFSPIVDILIKLDELQTIKNITGNLGEIGVFHGKSFIPLYLLANPNERVLAVDCFDQQQFNYDNSGPGCKFNSFINNVITYADSRLSRIEILQGDSSTMSAQNYIDKCRNGLAFRMFSIDGCHQARETEIDVNNVVQALAKGGIVIIDDFFNYSWPGVSAGVSNFLQKHDEIKPFFIGFNKVLLTHKEFADEYRNHLKKFYNPIREAVFFGSITAVFE